MDLRERFPACAQGSAVTFTALKHIHNTEIESAYLTVRARRARPTLVGLVSPQGEVCRLTFRYLAPLS